MIEWMSKYNPFDNANFSIKRPDPAFSDRSDNTAMYVGKFGPVSVGAYYSFGWNNDQSFSDRSLGRMVGGGLRYKSAAWTPGCCTTARTPTSPRPAPTAATAKTA